MHPAEATFTPSARRVLERATQHAAQRHSPTVEPEHLLLALLNDPASLALKTLAALNIAPEQIAGLLLPRLPAASAASADPLVLSERAQAAVYDARKEAAHLGHARVDAVHMLMGLLYEADGPAAAVLHELGLSLYDLRQQLMRQPQRLAAPPLPTLRGVLRPSPVFLIPLGALLLSGLALYLGAPRGLRQPLTILFILGGWITSVCLHEFGHALVAYLGGDQSVKQAGYLTLNPLKYTHPLLSLVLPVVFLLAGGIGLPGGAVYINRAALRSRRWEALVSAAGPLGTLLFGALISWPFWFDWIEWVTPQNVAFWPALALLAFFQVTALVFNLLPIPPLDGFGLLAPWLTWEVRQRAMLFGNITLLLLFMILWQDSPLTTAFWRNMYGIADLLRVPLDVVSVGWDQFLG